MQTSKSPKSDTIFLAAERARQRRNRTFDGIRFPSAIAACAWYWERAATLSSPQGMHPRTQTTRDGQQVVVRVDGGRGGDFDEVMVTLASIGKVLSELEVDYPKAHQAFMLTARDGYSQKKAAQMLGVGQGTVSAWRGLAEAYLAGALRSDVLAA